MTDVFVALRQRLPSLSKAERRIAEAIIEHPSLVVTSTITQLAEACDTSPASVARMCRAAGFAGYKEFRIAVAAANSREAAQRELFRVDDAEISPADSALDVVTKVAYQEARAIEETARGIDLVALDAVVDAIRSAPRIDIFGAGSSGLTAQDLQLKLHRIGIPGFCWSDAHLALTSVAITTPGSVAIGISHSGQTLETDQLLALARDRGAVTVAITNHPDSPVGRIADHVLTTSARESGIRTGAMSSRLAQMAIVDFILVRLVQQGFADAGDLLLRTYAAVQDHRIGPSS
ncbi:SIS domain-containing protein [Agromyces sp. CFH 90414]|uniref:SIS domain-containing protein n=1 Tax=Agromyces agglutinans TaxID=2662258 RepID=A0A6I2FBA2_9MICO|nr:MurR/RpiR family transcriptional regulator [Agromyces agglutinans]MRG60000.1 SIS domain-containing protein [Agromyces agglutinans]